MKIVVTSGGTKVPLDPVRDLTNKSRGTFGAKIATELLNRGQQVIFFCAQGSRSPFSIEFDFRQKHEWGNSLDEFCNRFNWCERYRRMYTEVRYQDFAEYATGLEDLVIKEQPDVLVLAAAVSDYLPSKVSDSKIRSDEEMRIDLEKAPKLISLAKVWAPQCKFVGFKLLVGATDKELIAAALESIEKNRCDLVVANDYKSLLKGSHEIMLVELMDQTPLACKYKDNLAEALADKIMEWQPCPESSSVSPAA